MRFYHVADASYNAGSPLFSRSRCVELGIETPWKWEFDEAEYADGALISLFQKLEDAEDLQATFGGPVLAVDLPDDPQERAEWGIALTKDAEGFAAVRYSIPGELITIISLD